MDPRDLMPGEPGQRLAKGSLSTLDAVAISISILAPGMAMLLNVPGVALIAGGSTPLAFLLGGVACLALALSNGTIGTLLVLRRMGLDGDVLGHAVMPGAAESGLRP